MELPPRQSPAAAQCTARKRREQAHRATARKVIWLTGMLQSSASHHTATHGGNGNASSGDLTCSGCAVLKQRICTMEDRFTAQHEHLQISIHSLKSQLAAAQASPHTHDHVPYPDRGEHSVGAAQNIEPVVSDIFIMPNPISIGIQTMIILI